MRRLTKVCALARESAIKAITGTETVMYKHGVWNSYEERKTAEVVNAIHRSEYGADVDLDAETGRFYVCTPARSDMW